MNRKLRNIVFVVTFIFALMVLNSISYAASFKTKVSPETVKVGDTITITLTADNAAGMYNVKISDTSILGVSSGSLSDFLEDESTTIKLKAKKAGTVTVTTSAEDMTDLDNSKNTVTGGGTYTIKITDPNANNSGTTGNQNTNSGSNNGSTNNNSGGNNSTTNNNSGSTTEKPKTKSTNAYLSTLGVRLSEADAKELGVGTDEYDFSGFKQSSLSYKVTVPYEVESLKVSYKAAHSGATVKVTGNTGFDVGSSNKITIKVTAEDGKTTKTYTIKVTRLAEEVEKPGNIIDDDKIEEIFLTSLSVKGIDISPEFSKDVYAYTATLSKNDVTEVEINAVANKENASIEVSGNTNLVVGENTINIVVKQEEGTSQAVYQITLTKEATAVTTTGEETNFMSSLIDNLKNYIVIAILVVVLMVVTVVVLIILLRKENKRLKNEETEEEYNVYENDENEFEDNKVEEVVEEPKIEEATNETETKNERRTRKKEKGRHSK